MAKDTRDENLDKNLNEKKSHNGFDHDAVNYRNNMEKERGYSGYMSELNMEELKNFGILATGVLLFIYSLGYLQILNWAIMAAAVFFMFYGAIQVSLWSKIVDSYKYIRSLFKRK